jgi:hypothetical protein
MSLNNPVRTVKRLKHVNIHQAPPVINVEIPVLNIEGDIELLYMSALQTNGEAALKNFQFSVKLDDGAAFDADFTGDYGLADSAKTNFMFDISTNSFILEALLFAFPVGGWEQTDETGTHQKSTGSFKCGKAVIKSKLTSAAGTVQEIDIDVWYYITEVI